MFNWVEAEECHSIIHEFTSGQGRLTKLLSATSNDINSLVQYIIINSNCV